MSDYHLKMRTYGFHSGMSQWPEPIMQGLTTKLYCDWFGALVHATMETKCSQLYKPFFNQPNISSENISTQCTCSTVYRRPIHVGWRTVRQASQRKWFHFNFLPGNKTLLPTKKSRFTSAWKQGEKLRHFKKRWDLIENKWGECTGLNVWKANALSAPEKLTLFFRLIFKTVFMAYRVSHIEMNKVNKLWLIWLGGGKGYFRHSSKLFYIKCIAVGQPPISYHFWVCWWTSFPEKLRPFM